MTSNSSGAPLSPADRRAGVGSGGASQLWVRAGSWLVRADHIVAVGVGQNYTYRPDGQNFVVQVVTAAMEGGEGDIAPASYELTRFADEKDARGCAAKVVERMGTWPGGYGTLHVTSKGGVVTSRPNPTRSDAQAAASDAVADDA